MLNQYYKKLGLSSNASIDEVKKAYRHLAKLYHPDRNKDKKAVKHFVEINEAYENILQQINTTTLEDDHKKRCRRKSESMDDRMQRARTRFEAIKQEEALRNELYFQKIAKGSKFKKYRIIAVCAALLGLTLLLDGFLPGQKTIAKVRSINYFNVFHGFHYDKVVEIQLKSSDKTFWVNRSFGFVLLHTDKVIVEKSLLFKDVLQISIPGNESMYSKTDYTIYGVFPAVSIMLFFPLIIMLFRSRTLLYSILFEASYYVALLAILGILLTNFRWLHLITLGYF